MEPARDRLMGPEERAGAGRRRAGSATGQAAPWLPAPAPELKRRRVSSRAEQLDVALRPNQVHRRVDQPPAWDSHLPSRRAEVRPRCARRLEAEGQEQPWRGGERPASVALRIRNRFTNEPEIEREIACQMIPRPVMNRSEGGLRPVHVERVPSYALAMAILPPPLLGSLAG